MHIEIPPGGFIKQSYTLPYVFGGLGGAALGGLTGHLIDRLRQQEGKPRSNKGAIIGALTGTGVGALAQGVPSTIYRLQNQAAVNRILEHFDR